MVLGSMLTTASDFNPSTKIPPYLEGAINFGKGFKPKAGIHAVG
jgi:hypothetical protein